CLYTEGLYICDCKEGWTGTFCDKPCDLDCGSHGTCGRVGNMTGCICHQNFTGNRCEEKRKIVLNVR
ncbi:EGF domain protein, partial [Biomphalaria glabrata]